MQIQRELGAFIDPVEGKEYVGPGIPPPSLRQWIQKHAAALSLSNCPFPKQQHSSPFGFGRSTLLCDHPQHGLAGSTGQRIRDTG